MAIIKILDSSAISSRCDYSSNNLLQGTTFCMVHSENEYNDSTRTSVVLRRVFHDLFQLVKLFLEI